MAIPCHDRHDCASPSLDELALDVRSIRVNCIDEDQALGMIDGTLTSDERANIERHIDTCSACRELLSGLAQQSVFSGKPSPSSFPASAAFAATQHAPSAQENRVLPETRYVALSVRMPLPALPAQTRAPRPPVPPSQVTSAPERVQSNARFLLMLGLGFGLFGFALLVMVLGAAGLFYAGGRLVEAPEPVPEPAPLPVRASVVPQDPVPLEATAPSPAVTAPIVYRSAVCDSDWGVLAQRTYVSETMGPPAFQAMLGCRVVMEEVTLRSTNTLVPRALDVIGDETIEVTIRNSRIEGDVSVVGAARLRLENCEIHGALHGPMEVRRSRHEGTRDAFVRFIP
jgi:hypothetical protein